MTPTAPIRPPPPTTTTAPGGAGPTPTPPIGPKATGTPVCMDRSPHACLTIAIRRRKTFPGLPPLDPDLDPLGRGGGNRLVPRAASRDRRGCRSKDGG